MVELICLFEVRGLVGKCPVLYVRAILRLWLIFVISSGLVVRALGLCRVPAVIRTVGLRTLPTGIRTLGLCRVPAVIRPGGLRAVPVGIWTMGLRAVVAVMVLRACGCVSIYWPLSWRVER